MFIRVGILNFCGLPNPWLAEATCSSAGDFKYVTYCLEPNSACFWLFFFGFVWVCRKKLGAAHHDFWAPSRHSTILKRNTQGINYFWAPYATICKELLLACSNACHECGANSGATLWFNAHLHNYLTHRGCEQQLCSQHYG